MQHFKSQPKETKTKARAWVRDWPGNKSLKGSTKPSYVLVTESKAPVPVPTLPKSPPGGKRQGRAAPPASPAAHLSGHEGQNEEPPLQGEDCPFLPDRRVQTQPQSRRAAPGSVLPSAALAEDEFFGSGPALT